MLLSVFKLLLTFSLLLPVVASLLLNLGSPVKEVRRAAVHCLQALGATASLFHPVIEHVIPKAEEVTSDAAYVIQVAHCTEGCACALHPPDGVLHP